MIKRPRAVLASLFMGGLAAIVVGWLAVPDGQFLEGLLLEIGGGILLFAALLLVERNLVVSLEESIDAAQQQNRRALEEVTERVGQVEESVADVRSEVVSLGEIGAETREALARRVVETRRVFEAFDDEVSPTTIDAILVEAERIDAVSPKGVRVPMSGTPMRLRIGRTDDPFDPRGVCFSVEDISGDVEGSITWDDETASEIMVRVVELLQTSGAYGGDIEPAALFERFRDHVRTVVELKTGVRVGPMSLGPVIEIPNDQWAVTTVGVECLEESYAIEKDRFDETDWVRHVGEKTWADSEKFSEAYRIARAIWEKEKWDWEHEVPF